MCILFFGTVQYGTVPHGVVRYLRLCKTGDLIEEKRSLFSHMLAQQIYEIKELTMIVFCAAEKWGGGAAKQ